MPVALAGSLLQLPTKFESRLNTTYIGPGAYGLMMSDILKPYYTEVGVY